MFTGLSAFPLTPITHDAVDEAAFIRLMERLVDAKVDSITALGSTGSYAYLSLEERNHVAALAVQHAGAIPVFVGVGALRTADVLTNARNAEKAGAAGLLLAPLTYQPLTDTDVFELFRTVTAHSALPVIVYDNPGTTHFSFTTELYRRIAELPNIASIKIPGVPTAPEQARKRIKEIRAVLPEHVTIGVSGDAKAAQGLTAGCDAWYSVIGGTLPKLAQRIAGPAWKGRHPEALAESERLNPLWQLFNEHGGSLRVIAAIAERLGLTTASCLPLPIQGLTGHQRAEVAEVMNTLGLYR